MKTRCHTFRSQRAALPTKLGNPHYDAWDALVRAQHTMLALRAVLKAEYGDLLVLPVEPNVKP